MSLVPTHRAMLASQAVQQSNEHGIPGDIVELGVWRGGMSCYMARTQLRSGSANRSLWLFDTFEGMPPPSEHDDRKSRLLYRDFLNGSKTVDSTGCGVLHGRWCYGALHHVQRLINSTGYPSERVRYMKGKVEETLRGAPLPTQIAVLRLDTDFYSSTLAELEVLWPLLSPGGWLYVDDFYDFRGCRAAVDQWLKNHSGWSGEAWKAGAFDRQTRTFHVRKSSPYDEAHPFERTF
jgi:O-methyltransferase